MLGSSAVALYPYLLISSIDLLLRSLTIFNSAASKETLKIGLFWFPFGFLLILLYTIVVYWAFKGKVNPKDVIGY